MNFPEIRTGCAGWSIPGQHRGMFGPGESVLARYATLFNAVEINSSFYRPHQHKTYARWAATAPDGFRFSVKLPRTISHEQRLEGTGSLLDRVLDETSALGDRLGGFLLQLPPSLAFDARIASAFFRAFRSRSDALLACEPRHASWFGPPATAMLERHRVARVDADPPVVAETGAFPRNAGWSYRRWHGSPTIYYSDYPEARLEALARTVREEPGDHQKWVVFDNTARGYATANAARFLELLCANMGHPLGTPPCIA